MKQLILFACLSLFLTSCSHTYYVVRHAEKEQPSPGLVMSNPNNPPLTTVGMERAEALKAVLADKKIHYIFSTNTIRTLSTIAPIEALVGIEPVLYTKVDSSFIGQLKKLKKNTLVVGHSNTVDDIVNALSGQTFVRADLQDNEYDRLFIIKYKGNKKIVTMQPYGQTHH